ncbi:MAG: PIN domain-containing protein, partial [Roseiflexaceae bacterium]|nr:PIN domain-containing protein [Roseiflexaceae bacterium]
KIAAYVSAITPVNIFYIARKLKGVDLARQAVAGLLNECQVASIDASVLRAAAALPLKDYEDAVQLASALHSRLDAIVTRDPNDYASDSLAIFSPSDLLATLARAHTGDP